MKILLTELGNFASGDPELWAETCRRLSPEHEITLLHRLPDPACISVHGLGHYPLHALPLPPLPDSCSTPEELDQALAALDPESHKTLHTLVASHDVIAIAPGGKFLDAYAYQNALAAVSVAYLQEKPYYILHQSIGPLDPGSRRELLCGLLRNAELVLIRDRISYRFVRQLIGKQPSVHLTADPLFALPAQTIESADFDVGLNFRFSFNGWVSPEDLLLFVEELLKTEGLRILIYTTTFELPPELVSAAEAMGANCHPTILAPSELHAVPGSCRVNVTDSFHGSIFSLRAGRPVVMCQADFNSWKLQGTFSRRWFGTPLHQGPNSSARRRTLLKMTRRVLRNPDRWCTQQKRRIPRLLELVESGWQAVFSSLQEKDNTGIAHRSQVSVTPAPRMVALIAAWNEERFIRACLEHHIQQGLEVVLLDNGSTDRTVEIASAFLGKGLRSIETLPRGEFFDWKGILDHKARLQDEIDADWFLHMDPDEFRLPPAGFATLRDWVAEADHQGFNALNFHEFTFLPTRESPDHDHPDFQKTLRWYYPFKTKQIFRMNAWKKQSVPIDLSESGGHLVSFPDRRLFPVSGSMRHYLFLSEAHAVEKYRPRVYKPEEVESGWHGWRSDFPASGIRLPAMAEMRVYRNDCHLDPADPLTEHYPFLDNQPKEGGA